MTEKKHSESLDDLSEVTKKWWSDLQDRKGDRARLRRCTLPQEVMFQPSYHELFSRIKGKGFNPDDTRLTLIAGLLSHIKESSPEKKLGTALGRTKNQGEGAIVKNSRLEQLLHCEETETLYRDFIRIIALLDHRVPIKPLVKDLYLWGNEKKRLKIKTEWAKNYYEIQFNRSNA